MIFYIITIVSCLIVPTQSTVTKIFNSNIHQNRFYLLSHFSNLTAIFFWIDLPPSEANAYDFASVELKQTAFRIYGVFLPTNNQEKIPIYFVEVQFQRDEDFYSRFFSEIFLYLHLYASTTP